MGNRGAIKVGKLNDAKIVRQSRIVNRAQVGNPTDFVWPRGRRLNICVNLESL